jgi:DNA-binding NarL/FixJ family response regulator
MNIAASDALSGLNAAIAEFSANAVAQKLQPAVANPADTIQLTEPEQVERLYSQGHTVPQIASNLDLTRQAVDRYLNISNSTG